MMRSMLTLGLGISVAMTGFAATVEIAADRMSVVDGQRTFVLGLYETGLTDPAYQQVADAGFNLVRSPDDTAVLDKLEALGLFAWLNTGYDIDLSGNREARIASLESKAARFANHPALMVWEVPDEALWNVWYGAEQWRRREGAMLSEKINALEDTAKAGRLREMMALSRKHRDRGEYAQWEDTVAAVWKELGEAQPNPELRTSTAPERGRRMADGMVEGYGVLQKLDPAHPVWMNHAPRNQQAQLAMFNRAADIVGCDIYPVPEYHTGHSDVGERSLAATGEYTDLMQNAAPGKPVWMVLQGFSWADLDKEADDEKREKNPRPSFEASRFMAYDTIVRGARGILYWGTAYIEKDSQLWEDLMRLVRELADLQPVLSAPDAPLDLQVELAETWGSVDKGVRILPKNVDGATWLLVVNEWSSAMTYTVSGLEGLDGTRYVDGTADREATVRDGRMTLGIRKQGVQVLRPVP
ncbi:MAG: hypothetical protein GY851_36130 [bacterium]|nr:hypothetical protein [bacterium]